MRTLHFWIPHKISIKNNMFLCSFKQRLTIPNIRPKPSLIPSSNSHLGQKVNYGFEMFLYSVILTEYVAIEPRVCVCACVCACVCVSVCVSATAQTAEPILMKFCTNDL